MKARRWTRGPAIVIGANWSVGRQQPWTGYGFSTIIAPGGKVLASAKSLHGFEIVYATIPTGAAGAVQPATEAPAGVK